MKPFARIILSAGLWATLTVRAFSGDSLNNSKARYLELKAGCISFLLSPRTPSGMRPRVSETFNIGLVRQRKDALLGINLDYTRYNLMGGPQTVGRTGVTGIYNIKQRVNFFSFSVGFHVMHSTKLSDKFRLELGPSIYMPIFRSRISVTSYYAGEQQPYPANWFPPEGITNTEVHSERMFLWRSVYFGLDLRLVYPVNQKLSIGFSNSGYMCMNTSIESNPYMLYKLPERNIYTIEELFWITSSLMLRLSF